MPMNGKTTAFAANMLSLIFEQGSIPGLAQNASTGTVTTLYISLHSSDPTVSGNQSSNEAAYIGYQRQAVSRSTGSWVISGNSISPLNQISFPQCTGLVSGTQEIEQFWGIGTASSGTGTLLYAGPISPSIVVYAGVTPNLSQGSTVTES